MHVCAISADAAIPDNPSSSNQSSTADKANLSAPVCDSVVLDRAAPSLAVNTQPGTTVNVGDLVTFAAAASDATSGLTGAYAWKWGDNTANGTGASATHTFTTPGTYDVVVETADTAGNAATAHQVITVKAAGTTPNPNPNPNPSPTTTATATPTATSTAIPTHTANPVPSATATPVTTTPTATPGPVAAGGAVHVDAPKTVKLARARKALPVSLTADAPGTVSVAVLRGGTIVAQRAGRITAGTQAYKLKLGRKARAGKHVVKVTFTPDGGKAAVTSVTVKVTGGKVARKAKASARASVAAAAKRVLPDGHFHGPRGRTARL